MLRSLSGKEPDCSVSPDEAVAHGAALHAGLILSYHAGKSPSFNIRNVNSHSLGVEIRQGQERVNDILIAKHTQLPTAASRVYYTVVENQPRVRVKVLQGEAPQADACISIGECWIEGLPPNLPRRSPVQVRCGVGTNGLIDVMALDMTSGKMARAEIHRSSGLSEEEIAREAEWVRSLRIQ